MEVFKSFLLKFFHYENLKNALDNISLSGNCKICTPELFLDVLGCVAVLALLSILMAIFAFKKREELRQFFNDFSLFIKSLFVDCLTYFKEEERIYSIGLILILLIGVFFRAYYLFTAEMDYDEAYSYVYFSSQNLLKTLTQQDGTNNHFFNSLLMKISAAIFGDSAVSVRLPAFIGGALNIFLGYFCGRALYNRATGLLTAFIISCTPFLLLYSYNARGYSLGTTFVILAFLIAHRISNCQQLAPWILFSIINALGAYTVAVALYVTGGILIFLLLQILLNKKMTADGLILLRNFAISVFAMLFLIFLLNLPVILARGLSVFFYGHLVKMPFWLFIQQLPSIFYNFWNGIYPSTHVFFKLTLLVGIVSSLLFYKKSNIPRFPIFIPFILSLIVITIFLRYPLPDRCLVTMLPFYILSASFGIIVLLEKVYFTVKKLANGHASKKMSVIIHPLSITTLVLGSLFIHTHFLKEKTLFLNEKLVFFLPGIDKVSARISTHLQKHDEINYPHLGFTILQSYLKFNRINCYLSGDSSCIVDGKPGVQPKRSFVVLEGPSTSKLIEKIGSYSLYQKY
ncbi:MAG: glycosyltransferase family 39 protein [Oligoflexia bacterium]|nr:glycosyltransferase family 39 protein [Oligoflexia bacterium]